MFFYQQNLGFVTNISSCDLRLNECSVEVAALKGSVDLNKAKILNKDSVASMAGSCEL